MLPATLTIALALTGAGSPAHALGATPPPTSSPAAAPAPAAPRTAIPARGPAQIRITETRVGRPIPSGFLGLSMELGSLYAYAGNDPHAVNPVFTRLIDDLVPGQSPVLRIGGDSTDRTWWPVPGMATPPWASYTLTPNWAAVAKALAQAIHGRLILGINLLANSTTIAATEADALLNGIGRQHIAAFEIGNEPEQYSTLAWYHTSNGTPVTARPAGYDFQTYLQEANQIRSALPKLPLAGPATGSLSWLSHLPALLAGEPGLKQVTFHRYPLNRCVTNPSSPLYPTVPRLLSSSSSEGLLRGVGQYVTLAHRHGDTFRVDELNAVTCGGEPGVSDTFAAGLWELDTQFWMARTGVDAVDVHIHPEAPAGQLFTFQDQAGRWSGSVRPQYYGLLMFSQAAPAGARLLRTSGPAPGQLRTWATLAPGGVIRVVLINDSLTSASTALVHPPATAVHPPATAGRATLERLQAPSAYATGGVSLGGQSFGSAGTLTGRRRAPSVRLIRGSYRVQLPAASAALLTIPAP